MQLPDYDFKLLPEAVKAAGIALMIFALTLLLDFSDDLDAILTNPEAYIRSMAPALLAVVATAFLGVMTRRRNGTAQIEKPLHDNPLVAPAYVEEPTPPPTFEERIEALPEAEREGATADVLGEAASAPPTETAEDQAQVPGRWLAVSVNGTQRDRILVPVGADKGTVIATALSVLGDDEQFTRADYDPAGGTLNLILQ